jgi:hypothetical protein
MPLVFEAMTAPGFAVFFDFGEKFVFDFEIFDDRFDDEIAIFDFRQIVFKISESKSDSRCRQHKRRGL